MSATLETCTFGDDGSIPNSSLPVVLYRGALADSAGAAAYQKLFAGHRWLGAWRDGIFPFHHFHSTAHEVLGIAAGEAEVMLGGPQGRRFQLRRGDVVVLPAGTGHCNLGSSAGLLVVGAYPDGMEWDLRRGNPAEHDEVLANIVRVPLPDQDPVLGADGALRELWSDAP
ncbi:MAG: cupin domain-containing protein [Solirubrobacterales bacterium]|nr:cupin domain-containing protein [Solirubrobacterales bacterium]MBV9941901.1 cupin domain-containing protein [Solirubrobacterales bacterium]